MTNLIVSFYCACRLCCGHSHGITASGSHVESGVTIAAHRSIPFGSIIVVPGFGPLIVQDRMSTRFKPNHVDVYVPNHHHAKQLGIKTLPCELVVHQKSSIAQR